MARKKPHKRKVKKAFLLLMLPILFLFALGSGISFWYESRAIPNPGDDYQMTVLPPNISHVLGINTGPSSTPQISIRVPIFLYHYVEYVQNDPGRQKLTIPPNILTSQIETLKNAGYTFINTTDLTAALSGKKKLPQKIIMLTFDDGYMDFYTDVYPILQKEQVKVVEYVIVNFLDRPNYMFTFQLKEVAKSPYVEIGAHTMDHYALAGMNLQEATYEITQSRKLLQDTLHLPINSFAYPYGSFDLQAVQIVKNAGFTNAVSTIPGIMQNQENKYFFNRLRPGYRTGQELLNYLQQNTFQPW